MLETLLSNLICFRFYLPNSVCNNFYSYYDGEMYLRTLCNMWHVCWIMYDLGCLWIVYQDPSWYSTDYRVYMGSSMIVRPLASHHCTCALINWLVLRHRWVKQPSHLYRKGRMSYMLFTSWYSLHLKMNADIGFG